VHFLTATIIEWIPALIDRDARDVVINALDFCRKEKGMRLYAYVIMENHLHLVVEAPELTGVIQSFKRHTAREIIRRASATNKTWLLSQLAFHKKTYKRESQYQVWQEGSHPQHIQGDAMLRQKIDYVHNNPVRRGWVDTPEHWRYSSARNYALNDHSVLEIDELPLR